MLQTHGPPDIAGALMYGVFAVCCIWLLGWYFHDRARVVARDNYERQSRQAKLSDIFPLPSQAYSEQALLTRDLAEEMTALARNLRSERTAAAAPPMVSPSTHRANTPVPTPRPSTPPAHFDQPVTLATGPERVSMRVPPVNLSIIDRPASTMPVATVPAPTGPPRFEPGEPTTLDDYESQEVIVRYLQAHIAALTPLQFACPPICLTGPAGTGKTALMKAFANSLRERNAQYGHSETDFIELFPADIATRADLERTLRRAAVRPAVLRVDEIQVIEGDHAVLLYELLANGEYVFSGDVRATKFPHLTVIAATTDWARLHEALRRRFEDMAFEPLSPAEIKAAVQRQPFPIEETALDDVISRTRFGGVMWEALRVYKQARTFALAERAERVEQRHVDAVFDLNGLDAFGLTTVDRRVLRVMIGMVRKRKVKDVDEVVAYGGAEVQVANVAKLDLGSYRSIVKPKLLARELVTTRSPYGQVLTDRAVEMYGHLATP